MPLTLLEISQRIKEGQEPTIEELGELIRELRAGRMSAVPAAKKPASKKKAAAAEAMAQFADLIKKGGA